MTTKSLGYVFVIFGVMAGIASLVVDSIGVGDERMGSSQLFGLIFGVLISVVGLSITIHVPEKTIRPGNVLRNGIHAFASLPVTAWVMSGFFVIFLLFFVSPVFLNPDLRMAYYNKYLFDRSPIGWDLEITMGVVVPWVTGGQSPYPELFYPPLTFILFAPMALIDYPFSYYLITFFTLSGFCSLMLLVLSLTRHAVDHSLFLLFFVSGLLSYGLQFELERGQSNIIAFFLCIVSVYIFYRHHDFRLVAYLLFSVSIHMKLYTAIFILMFVRDWKDWRNNLKRIAGLGLFNFALLFALGFEGFTEFMQTLTINLQTDRWEGSFNHSIKSFVFTLLRDGFDVIPVNALNVLRQNDGVIRTSLLIVVIACILAVTARAYRDRSGGLNPYLLLACTLGALIIPTSNDYTLPNLTAPMALFFSSLPTRIQGKNKWISLLLVLSISIFYSIILYPPKYRPYFLSNSFPPLFLILVSVTVLNILLDHPVEQQRLNA